MAPAITGSSEPWWEDPQTDWTRGRPARAAELLARAYEEPGAIRAIGEAAGLDWDRAPVASSTQEIWTWTLTEAARRDRVLDLVAVVLHDANSAAFHARLATLLGDRLGAANARLALRYGLPPPPTDGPDALLESLGEVDAQPRDEPVGNLEAITAVNAGLGDPRAYAQAILDATRRTAMIEVAGVPRGTGFLVGDDLMLTAAHVLDARNWPPSPVQPVEAVFDFANVGRSPAETGTRVPVAEVVTGSLPTASEASGGGDDWNAPENRLDFALLALATPVPPSRDVDASAGPRSHYPLQPTDYDFAANADFLIIQHPLGEFISYTRIRTAPRRNAAGTRIRYRGNTLNGSSGSPVIDVRGRLVAIHHYSQARENQGVPISIIARALLNGPFEGRFRPAAGPAGGPAPGSAAVLAVDPFATSALMARRPFVNRQNLRTKMREMAEMTDGTRTLAINGESGTGVSYSYRFAAHVAKHSTLCPSLRQAAPEGLTAVKIDLRAYVNVKASERRSRVAGDLLVALKMRQPTDPLAQEARNTTTLSKWVEATLRESKRQWWIFFDSIDSVTAIKQGEVDELIHALIMLADDEQVPLRIVLAGRKAEAFALKHADWAEQDVAAGLSRGQVDQWFRDRAREEGRAINKGRLDAKLSALFPDGGPLPEPRKLAPQLPTLLLEVLEADSGP